MFKDSRGFSGFSVDNLAKARQFYSEVLGLDVIDNGDMGIELQLAGGGHGK